MINRTFQIAAILSFILYSASVIAMTTPAATSGEPEGLSGIFADYGKNNNEIPTSKASRNNSISLLNNSSRDANDKSSNSEDGFGALLIVTSDKDWESKWNTPKDTVPHFTRAHSVKRGDSLTILIFFVNPKADQQNSVNVLCDIKAIRPDGSVSINESNLLALKGELLGNPKNIRLAKPVIQFIGEPKDPLGEWKIEVSVKDMVRSVSVPVKASFILVEEAGKQE